LLVTALLAALTGPLARPLSAQTAPDSSVYVVVPGSRLVVKTGKSGLFGFAGHAHVIRARSVTGALVYRPGRPTSSLHLRVPTESLQVLTPPDTAEIRKVTEAMRTEVLHPDRFPTMTFAADSLDARRGSMHFQLAVTMEGTTRPVPVAADVAIGPDTIRATGSFAVKQTDFGIKPFSGGPAGTVKVADRVTFCFDLIAVRGATNPRAGDEAAVAEATQVPGCVDSAQPAEPRRRPM
jgi:polyisoprenoid-binding protein YceI